MKSGVRHAGAAGAAALLLALLASCEQSAVAPEVGANPPAAVRSRLVMGPALPKAKVLGPVSPPVFPLAANQKEPEIRIKVTAELDRPTMPTAKLPGRIDFYKLDDGNYVGINVVPLETYLPYVLAHEIGYASWDIEAYKAQAVASRTYAMYSILSKDSDALWDVASDTSSQMYGQIKPAEKPAYALAAQAVAATRGFVLCATVGNQTGVFCAFFSSSDGGAEAEVYETRGDYPVPALPAQLTGDFENLPGAHFTWPTMMVPKADISRAIAAWGARNEDASLMKLAAIRSVTIAQRNATTRRPIEFLLTDARGQTAPIRAEEFRLALLGDPGSPKPLSSNFDIQDGGTVIYLVNGHGYGHGMGMSQWGAEALAQRGVKASQILTYYYPHSILTRAW